MRQAAQEGRQYSIGNQHPRKAGTSSRQQLGASMGQGGPSSLAGAPKARTIFLGLKPDGQACTRLLLAQRETRKSQGILSPCHA
jgi:hypothetical protein